MCLLRTLLAWMLLTALIPGSRREQLLDVGFTFDELQEEIANPEFALLDVGFTFDES